MTITTKKSANGKISGYYVDGVKVRKNEIDGIINSRRDEIITVDYYDGLEFKMLTGLALNQLKVVFTRDDDQIIMTEAAADELGYRVIKNYTGNYYGACLVEKIEATEANPEDYAITPEAMDAAVEAETELASVESTTANVNLYATENELNALLKKVTAGIDDMDVTLQDGNKTRTRFRCAHIRPEYYHKSWLIVTIMGDLWGRYDTPDQVEQVINLLKAAIERGDKSFTFPKAIEVANKDTAVEAEIKLANAEPTIREKFLAAKEEIHCVSGRYLGNNKFAQKWERKVLLTWQAISKEHAAFMLQQYYGLTIKTYLAEREKWVAEEISRGAAQMAIEDQARNIKDKIARESKPLDTDNVFDLLPTLDELSDVGVYNFDTTPDIFMFPASPTDVEDTIFTDDERRNYIHNGYRFIAAYLCNGFLIEYPTTTFAQAEQYLADFCVKSDWAIKRINGSIIKRGIGFDTPIDDFTAKLAKLQAKVNDTQAALLKAHDAHKAAEKDFDAADIAYRYAAIDIAHTLNAKLDLPIDTLDVTTQNGLNWIIALDKVKVTFADDAFKFHCELSDGTDFTLGAYDTPAQAEKVINLLKVALANHHTEFVFPMLSDIDDFDNPDVFKDTRDSLKRAMNIALNHYQGFCHVGNLTAAEYELSLYDICRKALKEVA